MSKNFLTKQRRRQQHTLKLELVLPKSEQQFVKRSQGAHPRKTPFLVTTPVGHVPDTPLQLR
jgi:hypothetical protein